MDVTEDDEDVVLEAWAERMGVRRIVDNNENEDDGMAQEEVAWTPPTAAEIREYEKLLEASREELHSVRAEKDGPSDGPTEEELEEPTEEELEEYRRLFLMAQEEKVKDVEERAKDVEERVKDVSDVQDMEADASTTILEASKRSLFEFREARVKATLVKDAEESGGFVQGRISRVLLPSDYGSAQLVMATKLDLSWR
eukprot:g4698.t1